MSEDDPFGCFGGGDDESDEEHHDTSAVVYEGNSISNTKSISKPQHASKTQQGTQSESKRSEDCGVLSYHQGTEVALLAHVRNAVAELSLPPPRPSEVIKTWDGSPEDIASSTVLVAVDEFCRKRHWMMHVGPDKGSIITEKLQKAMEEKQQKLRSEVDDKEQQSSGSFLCVELGTYCGYAACLLGRQLKKFQAEHNPTMELKLYTVEANPKYVEIARELIQLARLDDIVTVLEIDVSVNIFEADDAASKTVSKEIQHCSSMISPPSSSQRRPQIDFLFIDHDKDAYLPDLQRFEKDRLVRAGSWCVADNVVFARILDYMDYMKKQAEKRYVETETILSKLEYSEEDNQQDGTAHDEGGKQSIFEDGIEVSRYLKNPHGFWR